LSPIKNIAGKIRRIYRRDAAVIYPGRFERPGARSWNLITWWFRSGALQEGRYCHYAFNKLKLPLKIAGEGPLKSSLQQRASSNIEFLGWVDDSVLPSLYGSCQALIFRARRLALSLGAQASGRPVIAYGRGGDVETVIPLLASRQVAETHQQDFAMPS
jgi:hypothetical protein